MTRDCLCHPGAQGEGADTYAKLVHILSGKKRKEEEEDGYHTTISNCTGTACTEIK